MTRPWTIEGRIWTNDAKRPWARSVTLRGDRVIALDAPAPADAVVTSITRGVIIPGLIDAHVHFLNGGLALGQLDLRPARSRAEFERLIAEHDATLPPDAWLVARGWSCDGWSDAELPAKAWLACVGDRPAVCHRVDEHAVVVNDAVLACVGREALDDPAMSPFVVRAGHSGAPTGLLLESAAWQLVNPRVPRPSPERLRTALVAAERHALALGVTTVGAMEYRRSLEEVYEPLRAALRVRCRITLLDRTLPLDVDFARTFRGDDRLAIVGFKAFLDGTLGSRTARMLEPYADAPDERGAWVELARSGMLETWAASVVDAGLSPSMHAIGDAAVRRALDVVEALADRPRGEPRVRPRIEHAQHVDAGDLPRFRAAIASMQPAHKHADGAGLAARLGRERVAAAFRFRELLEHAACLAFGSDWPIATLDPLAGAQAAITGVVADGSTLVPGAGLGVEDAFRAYTSGAAEALGLVDAGVLRPGACGDLVFLDCDPFAIDWAIARPRVVQTVTAGRARLDHAGGVPSGHAVAGC